MNALSGDLSSAYLATHLSAVRGVGRRTAHTHPRDPISTPTILFACCVYCAPPPLRTCIRAGRSDVEQICDNNEMPVTNVFSTQFDRSALRLLIRVHHSSSSSRRKQCVNVQPGLKSTRRETNEISASIDIGSSTPSDIVVVHTSHLCRPSCIRSSSLLLYIYIYTILSWSDGSSSSRWVDTAP